MDLEIPLVFLWNQQIVFISAFNHFPLPVVMCSLFTPWIPLCICWLHPTPSSFTLLFLSPYYETEELRSGEEMKNGVENANAGYFFGLIRVHYTLYFAGGLEDLLVS